MSPITMYGTGRLPSVAEGPERQGASATRRIGVWSALGLQRREKPRTTAGTSSHAMFRRTAAQRPSTVFDLGRKNGANSGGQGTMGRSTVPGWRSGVGYHLGASGGTAEMAHEVVRLAVASEAQGGSSSAFVSEIIEDWCGTPWPRKWPWPGPRPDTEAEGPSPEPW